ncbi:AAA family ATPase [Sphingomonas sp. GM_Shp_2]|uniref:AAA family ATPase n=1 Tax=Sphingomonas sp. GM_Shp_2 TaxID=2937380 RepID=UPI00226AAB6D|nr:AAA family ATPase [Sphingomonas sp. GM_Shp_2]
MTPAEAIARHFGGDWDGSQGAFPTPGHSSRDRGTTVRDADNFDDVVFHCHNGELDWKTLKDECRKLGLLPQRGRPDAPAQWVKTGRYEYTDADGVTVYQTVRIEKRGERKKFIAQQPNGQGGWINNLQGVERILYRLPDVLAGREADEIVYLVEGERKADKLADWGLTGTAIAFGAQGWNKGARNYARDLAGRTVVILPDNDDTGRAFAQTVRQALENVGCTVAIVALPGLSEKGDIIDWRGSADDLRALTDAALRGAGEPEPVTATVPDLLPLIDPGAWHGMIAPVRQWALQDWIPARQATYLTGAGSAGKSLLAQQLATCIAIGRPFLGIDTRQSVAIYVTCEDDADELHRRQAAICQALGIDLRDLSGKLHLVSLAGAISNELATFDPQGRMGTTKAWETLHATVLHTGAGFIALDNVAHMFAGNENIRNQVAAFCGLLNRLAVDGDASVLFIGHPNKAGDAYSGSTAWENQVRSRIFLDRPHDEDGEVMDPDARQISRAKANYARNGETVPFRWHQWAFVQEADLPTGVHAQIAAVAQENAENERFLKCLAKATEEKRAMSPNKAASNYAPREFTKMPTGSGITEKGFAGAMQRLLHTGQISNGMRVYQRSNRTWATGLGVAQTLAQTPAQTDAHRRTNPADDTREDAHKAARTPEPIYKYIRQKDSGWSPEVLLDDCDYDEDMPL